MAAAAVSARRRTNEHINDPDAVDGMVDSDSRFSGGALLGVKQWHAVGLVWRAWTRHRRRRHRVTTVNIRDTSDRMERMSRGFTKLAFFLVWLALLFSVVTLQTDPLLELDASALLSKDSTYRADYSMQRAILSTVTESEYLYHDVTDLHGIWLWVNSLVATMHDSDAVHSAGYDEYVGRTDTNSTGYVADYNKYFSVLFVTQSRRALETCKVPEGKEDAYAQYIPACFGDVDIIDGDSGSTFLTADMDYYVGVSGAVKPNTTKSDAAWVAASSGFVYDIKLHQPRGFGLLLDLGGFGSALAEIQDILAVAEEQNWLDKQTHTVRVQLFTVNANIGMFNKLTIDFIIDMSGFIRVEQSTLSIPMRDRYDTSEFTNVVRIVLELALLVATTWVAVDELRSLCESPTKCVCRVLLFAWAPARAAHLTPHHFAPLRADT
jgi:hypothetical protein